MPARKKRESPRVGATFEKVYKAKKYTMSVVKMPAGVAFRVGNHTFPSPSAAAKSITKNEINGWKFWGIEKPE